MTFTFRAERDALVAAFATATRAVPSRYSAMPVLYGVKIEIADSTARITGTDVDLTVVTTCDVQANEPATMVLPARLTLSAIRALEPGVITVEGDTKNVAIVGGRTNYSVKPLPADEYPNIDVSATQKANVDGETFADALAQVTPAAANDDARPIITGVLCTSENSHLRLVATDSYRLAVRDVPSMTVMHGDEHVLIPARALDEVARLIKAEGNPEVSISLGQRNAKFVIGKTMLMVRIIEGEFPNYRGLIPSSYPSRFVADRESLLDAVRRVALMAREAVPVRCNFESEMLTLDAITQDVGNAHEEVAGVTTGTPLLMAFNPEYMRDGIEVCKGDTVSIEYIDTLKPAVLRSTTDLDFTYLLMPVRIS